MKFTFVTLFKNIVDGYFQDSILKRAISKELLHISYSNPRDFSTNKHHKVDDTAVGGGAGMVMNPQPLFDCLDDLKKQDEDVHIIFLSTSTLTLKDFAKGTKNFLVNPASISFLSVIIFK